MAFRLPPQKDVKPRCVNIKVSVKTLNCQLITLTVKPMICPGFPVLKNIPNANITGISGEYSDLWKQTCGIAGHKQHS
jgi:hypothetical protein